MFFLHPLMASDENAILHDVIRDRKSALWLFTSLYVAIGGLPEHIAGKERPRLNIALLKESCNFMARKPGTGAKCQRKRHPVCLHAFVLPRKDKQIFVAAEKINEILKYPFSVSSKRPEFF
jgi:hypothetical protein